MEISNRLSLNDNYQAISFEDALTLTNYKHAAHCCIYALNPHQVFNKYPSKAAILMQPRFDGMLGFPGGMADKGGDIVTELNRELKEEINLDIERFQVKKEDHVISHKCTNFRLCVHFFQLQVSMEDLKLIEKEVLNAVDYGDETFGTLRVPVYTMEDSFRGLPAFLCNNFVGNARDQLLIFLAVTGMLTVEELLEAASWRERTPKL